MNALPFLLVVFGYIALSNGQGSTSVLLPNCQHAQCQDADWWCPNPIQTSGCCGRCKMDCRAALCPIGPPGCVVPPGECCCITANVEKPGTCPRTINSFGHGACPEMCSSDQECPGRQKCCSPGCGRRCMNPIQNVEKPGTCPQSRRDNFIGICIQECLSDQECRGRQKCCSIGCGTQCMNPAPTAPDCSAVFCAEVPIHCQHSVIPPGQCCRRCLDRPRGYDRRRG